MLQMYKIGLLCLNLYGSTDRNITNQSVLYINLIYLPPICFVLQQSSHIFSRNYVSFSIYWSLNWLFFVISYGLKQNIPYFFSMTKNIYRLTRQPLDSGTYSLYFTPISTCFISDCFSPCFFFIFHLLRVYSYRGD